MYLVHFGMSTVSQKRWIPSKSSSFVRGFTSRRKNSFSSCQIFSIGLRSGDSGGVFSTSWWNWLPGNPFHGLKCVLDHYPAWICGCCRRCLSRKEAGRACCKISVYSHLSMIPSKMHIPDPPWRLIPAQTWTFTGCLALQHEGERDWMVVGSK